MKKYIYQEKNKNKKVNVLTKFKTVKMCENEHLNYHSQPTVLVLQTSQ